MRAFIPLTAALLVAVPAVAFGAETLRDFINIITEIVFLTVPFAAALLFFFWNLYQLIATVGDPEKKKQAKTRLIWSIIAMFILFSLAGLVAMLQQTFFRGTTAETGQVQDFGFTPPPTVGTGQGQGQGQQGTPTSPFSPTPVAPQGSDGPDTPAGPGGCAEYGDQLIGNNICAQFHGDGYRCNLLNGQCYATPADTI